jgi:hypothetical protein
MQQRRKQRLFVTVCRGGAQLLLEAIMKWGSAACTIWRSFVYFLEHPDTWAH